MFTKKELGQLHRYCLKYRNLVRGGGTPSALQDLTFMTYQAVCYEQGVACD